MKLSEKEIQELKDNKISIEDLKDQYFVRFRYGSVEAEVDNILKLLNDNICSFEEIVDKFKSLKNKYNKPYLYILLYNKELFEELIQNNRLNKEDLEYLLNKINNSSELHDLRWNTSLINYILNEFVLNKGTVDRFNKIIEKIAWYKDHNIHTIFEYIEHYYKNNEEILKLNELNEKVYLLNIFNLTKDQKLELIEVLKDNEVAQNRLTQIIENHVESNYDFDSLIAYLNKQEKKAILNI